MLCFNKYFEDYCKLMLLLTYFKNKNLTNVQRSR